MQINIFMRNKKQKHFLLSHRVVKGFISRPLSANESPTFHTAYNNIILFYQIGILVYRYIFAGNMSIKLVVQLPIDPL